MCKMHLFTRSHQKSRTSHFSQVGGGVGGGEVLHAEANHLLHGRRREEEATGEDLLAGLAEVLRQKSVQDGVDTGVAVGQAVRQYAESEGGVIQGKPAELHPHGDDVMGHPADQEGSDHQQNRLCCLSTKEESTHREEQHYWPS